jgi:cation diffusion facilitator family transporter
MQLIFFGRRRVVAGFARGMPASRVSAVNIALNAGLSAVKLASGLAFASAALLSDAADNISDVFISAIAFFGQRASEKDADAGHPYGHERLECVVSIAIAALLFLFGAGIGYRAVRGVMTGIGGNLGAPGAPAAAVALFSAAAKALMYHYTNKSAARLNSTSLRAVARNYLGDALASLGGLAGIIGARAGIPLLDPAAGALLCLLLLKTSVDVFREAATRMTDRACDEGTVEAMRELIMSQEGVFSLDDIKTRVFSARIYADIEISADGSQSLHDAHAIAERVHDALEAQFPLVKHCTVHVNPSDGRE